MSESTQPASFTKLRTTIIVVSMIVMPLCAIVGVKMPKFLNDLTTESVGVASSDAKAKPAARPSGTSASAGRDRDRSKTKPLERAVSLAEAESVDNPLKRSNVVTAGASAEPVFPAPSSYASLASQTDPSANNDVRAGGSGVSQAVALESLAGAASAGGSQPVGFDTASPIRALPPAEEQGRAAPPTGGYAAADQFSQIQTRLKALGATHYTLETWGAGGNSYRFQCRMAAGHSADYTRQFEATDTDALRTMQTVLDEVEAWKAGRLP